MQTTLKSLKSWFFLSLLLFAFQPYVSAQSSGIWRGTPITFTKADYADHTTAKAQDRITDTVWITRKTTEGIFNIKVNTGYNGGTSPSGTLWAFGTTSNLSSLTFRPWQTAIGQNPPGMVNQNMVMYLVKDNIYIDVVFKSWTQGGAGGGFSYTRATDCRDRVTKKVAACGSYTSPSKKYTWTKSGVYRDTLQNAAKCDSILTLNLTIMGPDTIGSGYISGCGSVVLPFSKRKVTQTGVYNDTLKKGSICGYDSILIANVFIYALPERNMSVTACDSFVSPSGNFVWKKSGMYVDYLAAIGTCDTLVNINLTINTKQVAKVKVASCERYVSVTNKVYTSSGNYLDTIQTTKGCDSIVDLSLTINKSIVTKISPIVCTVKYTSPSGKHIWKANGTYYDTLTRSTGCDSILEVNLRLQPEVSSMSAQSCDPWLIPSKKRSLVNSGVFYDTLQTKDFCDSVITINFTRLRATFSTDDFPAAMNKFISPTGKVWTTSGVYFDTLTNAVGCDSFLTFNVTIQKVDLGVVKKGDTLTAVANGVKYQWLDCNKNNAVIPWAIEKSYVVTKQGKYAVKLNNLSSSDTSACVEVLFGSVKNIDQFGIQVYPNPNNGSFNLDLGSAVPSVSKVQVINAIGEVIFETQNINQLMQLDLTKNTSAGIYFVRVTGANLLYTKPVMVK